MRRRRARANRALPPGADAGATERFNFQTPRRVGWCQVDFATLTLPKDVSRAFAESFWSYRDVRSECTLLGYWHGIRAFARFVAETQAITCLKDIDSNVIARYIEWINRQVSANGTPLGAATRPALYSTVRQQLRWLQRCRPHLRRYLSLPHLLSGVSERKGPGRSNHRRQGRSSRRVRSPQHLASL